MFNRSRTLLSAVALAGIGAFMPALPTALRPQVTVSSKRKKGLFNGALLPQSGMLMGYRGAGMSVAQAKRVAAKRRNRLRHRRAVKG